MASPSAALNPKVRNHLASHTTTTDEMWPHVENPPFLDSDSDHSEERRIVQGSKVNFSKLSEDEKIARL
jgi:hypothetical protein